VNTAIESQDEIPAAIAHLDTKIANIITEMQLN
jgi:hypothetical protein